MSAPARVLYLLRHAKSSWDDPDLPDHDRPLAARGKKALPRLRRYVSDAGVAPTLVLCSSARRAVSTCEGIIEALPGEPVVQVEDGLYTASGNRLLDRLREVDEEMTGVLLIGHNPGLHSLAVSLVGRGDEDLRAQLAAAFPTGALATLMVPDLWADLAPSATILRDFVVPRQLP
jgi:phosphohistidine phosphatase